MVVATMQEKQEKSGMMKRKSTDNSSQSKAKKFKSLKSTGNENPDTSCGNSTISDSNIKHGKSRKDKSLNAKKALNKGPKKPSKEPQNEQSQEKPDWIQVKKDRKELREKRKVQKLSNIYPVALQVKQLAEKFRRTDCSDIERDKLILQAHALLKNHYSKVIFTHDMSRIVQRILKYSPQEICASIFCELKPCLVSMLESKYAKNCIKIMVDNCLPEIKSQIVSACYGNVIKLLSSIVSAPVLEYLYVNGASNSEKNCFKQEFYGDMYKNAKDNNVKKLSDVFNTAPQMKSATLTAVKGNLLKILNKKLVNSTLVHHVLWEFFNECSTEDRNELITVLRSFLFELSQTKYGSKVGTMCIWYGTNKDKKIMMKALKDNVKSVCMSEHGYRILLALFDSVDDTVLVRKIILSEVLKDLTEIALNDHGKHVILYLVARRDPHYFPPDIVEYLRQGDNTETSKKPGDVKAQELLPAILDPLLEAITKDTHTWISSNSSAMVTLAILKAGSGEKLKDAFESIAKFITNSNSKITDAGRECIPIEHVGLHMALKKLIQYDKILQEKGEPTFGEVLIGYLTGDVIEKWIMCNRGCFLIVALFENEADFIIKILQKKFKPVSKQLQSIKSPGAQILLKKLQ